VLISDKVLHHALAAKPADGLHVHLQPNQQMACMCNTKQNSNVRSHTAACFGEAPDAEAHHQEAAQHQEATRQT
jgi:hypothetical protein